MNIQLCNDANGMVEGAWLDLHNRLTTAAGHEATRDAVCLHWRCLLRVRRAHPLYVAGTSSRRRAADQWLASLDGNRNLYMNVELPDEAPTPLQRRNDHHSRTGHHRGASRSHRIRLSAR